MTKTQEFLDRIALERHLLSEGVPMAILVPTDTTLVMDATGCGTEFNLDLRDDIGQQAVDHFKVRLLSLFFGAAWKVLDALVELAIASDSKSSGSVPWQQADKSKLLLSGVGSAIAPLPADIWGATVQLYLNTIEVRHALVHRTAKIASNGDLVGETKSKDPLHPVSSRQQAAFCELVQFLVLGIESAVLTGRQRKRCLSRLAVLQSIHGVTTLPAARDGDVVRVKYRLTDDGILPVAAIKARAAGAAPMHVGIDLVVSKPGVVGVLRGELDDIDGASITIDFDSPPTWLERGLLNG